MSSGLSESLVELPTTTPATTYTPFTEESQIIELSAESSIRIYYLEAPLSVLGERIGITFTNSLIEINGFHTAVGFQAVGPGNSVEFTYGLDLANGFAISSFVPEITYPRGDPVLTWRDLNVINQGSVIDRNYWDQSTYIATVPASTVTALQRWILNTWIPNNPIYSLFSGVKSEAEVDLFNPIFRPSFCDTFCFALFDYLIAFKKEGGLQRCIDYPVVPNISVNAFIEAYPGAITPVNFESEREAIVEFYLRLEATISELTDLEEETLEILRELEAGGANESTLLRQVAQELFTTITLLATVYDGFDVIYYYGYGPAGSDRENEPTYWRIEAPRLFLAYRNGPLERSYRALNTSGVPVEDTHSSGSPNGCISTPTDVVPGSNNIMVMAPQRDSKLIYWLIGGVLFVIVIGLITGAVVYQTRRQSEEKTNEI